MPSSTMRIFLSNRFVSSTRKLCCVMIFMFGFVCVSLFVSFEEVSSRSSYSAESRPRIKSPSRGTRTLFVKASFPFHHGPHLMTKSNEPPTIPHIIHQVWLLKDTPPVIKKWMTAWKHFHPDWEYRFWTRDDVVNLLNQFYHQDVERYQRASPEEQLYMSRYFILHRFGGVFADVDVEPLQALDNWTFNYNCVFSQDNSAHMYLLNGQLKASLSSSIMLCQPQHPLLSKAIELFHSISTPFPSLTEVYNTCFNSSSAHAQGWQKGAKFSIVPSEYFLPTFDVTLLGTLVQKCDPIHTWQLVPKGQLLCQQLRRDKFRLHPGKGAYTTRHWFKMSQRTKTKFPYR